GTRRCARQTKISTSGAMPSCFQKSLMEDLPYGDQITRKKAILSSHSDLSLTAGSKTASSDGKIIGVRSSLDRTFPRRYFLRGRISMTSSTHVNASTPIIQHIPQLLIGHPRILHRIGN